MKISICIPTFNRKILVCNAIDSALNQTKLPYEIIVVDNDSSDGTFDYLNEKYGSNIKLYKNQVNLGPVGNWRACLEHSSGDYIKYLYSDDVLHLDYLNIASILIGNNPNCTFFSNQTSSNFEEVSLNENYSKLSKSTFEFNCLLRGEYPLSPSMYLLPRAGVEAALRNRVANFDRFSGLKTGAGYDLKCILESVKIADQIYCVNSPLVKVGMGEDSISISKASTELSNCYVAAKYNRLAEKNPLLRYAYVYLLFRQYRRFIQYVSFFQFLKRFKH